MSAPQPPGATVPEVNFGPDERIQTTRLAAVGGVVAWAGTVLPAALSRHRSEVPLVWWVLAVVILVAFIALADSLVKPRRSDRVFAVVIVVASIAATFIYGADSITPVFLVLSAGVVGWGSSPRFLVGIGVLQTVALVLALVQQEGTVVWAVVYAALMFFAGLMVTVVVREGKSRDAAYQTAKALAAANERLRQVNTDLAAAQARLAEASKAQERLRISRDLHDSMGHQVTALSMTLELIDHHPHDDIKELVAQARMLATGLLRDVRGAVTQLRTGHLRLQPRDELSRWVRSIPRPTVSLDIDAAIDDLPPEAATAAIRIVQEAVTNAAKHSTGDQVWVRAVPTHSTVAVTIRDNGVVTAPVEPGHGFAVMLERAEGVGATVTWYEAEDGGIEVRADFPLPGERG